MNILQVNTSYARGGAAAAARALHQAVNGNGGRLRSVYAFGRGPAGPDAFRLTGPAEVVFRGAKMRLTGLEGGGPASAVDRLGSAIGRIHPALVHLHNIHGYYLDFIRLFGLLRGLDMPLVWTLHDCWPLTGRCAFPEECEAWREGCGRCPGLADYPRSFVDAGARMWRLKKESFSSVPGVVLVAPSEWLAGMVGASHLAGNEVRVIGNGVDTEVFRPIPTVRERTRHELGVPAGKKVIMFAAADLKEERKGARFILELLPALAPDRYFVVTAGAKLPGLDKAFPDVRQMGFVADRTKLAGLYNAADVFCATSTSDNFPTTVLEAMACATPTVAFAAGGIPEQLAGGCGLTVPVGRASGLAEAIGALFADEAALEARRTACREKALDRYSMETFLHRYLALYEELLDRHERRTDRP